MKLIFYLFLLTCCCYTLQQNSLGDDIDVRISSLNGCDSALYIGKARAPLIPNVYAHA